MDRSKNHHLTAKKYLDEALNLALKTNATLLISNVRLTLLRWYREEKRHAEALELAQEILNNTDLENPNNTPILIQVYDLLVAIYANLGDTKNVISSHQQFSSIMARISDVNLHQSLQEMSVKYETAEKQLEIERKQSEINRQKNILYLSAIGLLGAGAVVAMLVYIIVLHIRRNRLLAETNATKDKFFSIISHDMKNPAVAIRDAVHLLLENSNKWDSDSLTNYLRRLYKLSNEHVELLYLLLGWAQVQAGRVPYQPRQFDLVASLNSGLGIIRNMAEEKEVMFDVQMPESAIITGDDKMLATVVRNLLVNAVKFTAKGGTVKLDVLSNSKDGTHSSSAKYTVSVSDTGMGMSAEQIHNLFRLDRNQSSRDTNGETGVGLGMIVCREFLEKHGCKLLVESEEGKGSRFWFCGVM